MGGRKYELYIQHSIRPVIEIDNNSSIYLILRSNNNECDNNVQTIK